MSLYDLKLIKADMEGRKCNEGKSTTLTILAMIGANSPTKRFNNAATYRSECHILHRTLVAGYHKMKVFLP